MDEAHSTEGSVFNSYIPKVTEPGPNKKTVYTYAEGRAAIAKGQQIDYVGAAGQETLNQYHNWFADQAVEQFSPNGSGNVIATIPRSQIEALANSSEGA